MSERGIRRAVVVDDEPPARRRMAQLLAAHPDVSIVGNAASVSEAIDVIRSTAPDLLFLDVELARGTTFELFDRVEVHAAVIFVTAFSHYAVRAFEVNALDYLLKPIEPSRLALALERIDLRAVPQTALADADMVALRTTRGLRFAPVEEIVLVSSCDDYTEVRLANGECHLSELRMTEWEGRVPAALVRVHRRHIVRLSHVRSLERRANGWELRLHAVDEGIPVGRSWLNAVRGRLILP